MRLCTPLTLPLLALCLFPIAHAHASGCGCGSIQAMLFNTQQQIIQQVNMNTNAEAQSIRSEITSAAQNIIGTIRVSSETIVRAIVDLKESTVSALKGQTAAKEAQKTIDLYGKAGQPNGLCGSTAMGAGLQSHLQASKSATGHASKAGIVWKHTFRKTRRIPASSFSCRASRCASYARCLISPQSYSQCRAAGTGP